MKKTALLLVAAAAIFASCNKKNTPGFDVDYLDFGTYHFVGTTNTSKCQEFGYIVKVTNTTTKQDTTIEYTIGQEVALNIDKGQTLNVLIQQYINCKDYYSLEKTIDLD